MPCKRPAENFTTSKAELSLLRAMIDHAMEKECTTHPRHS
jgi:hypothetical protein